MIPLREALLFRIRPGSETVEIDGTGYAVGSHWAEGFGLCELVKDRKNKIIHKNSGLYGIKELFSKRATIKLCGNELYIKTEKYEFVYDYDSKNLYTGTDAKTSPQAFGTFAAIAAYAAMSAEHREAFEKHSEEEAIAWLCDYIYYIFVKGNTFYCIDGEEGQSKITTVAAKPGSPVVYGEGVHKETPEEFLGVSDEVVDAIAEKVAYEAKSLEVKEACSFEATGLLGNNKRELMQDIMAGKFFFDIEWPEEVASYIPDVSLLEGFIPIPAFWELLNKFVLRISKIKGRVDAGETKINRIMGKDYLNLSLVGDPGSGKTMLMQALAAATHMPFFALNINPSTEEDTFQGMNKVVEGALRFVPTEFLLGFKYGGLILMDEVNFANPAYTAMLNDSIVAPFTLKEDGYKPVTRNPYCIISAAHNVGTEGTRKINEAFNRRLMYTKNIEAPSEEDFIKFLTLYHEESEARWAYKCYLLAKEFLENDDAEAANRSIAIDVCDAIINDIEEGIDRIAALENIWAKVKGINPELADELKQKLASVPRPKK